MGSTKKFFVIVVLFLVLSAGYIGLLKDTALGIDDTIQRAEQLVEQGDYAAAWRILYDRMQRPDGKQAAHALDQIEWTLLHDDRSALMREFRDPTRSIQDKQQMVSEIVAAIHGNTMAETPLLNNHDDPFVQVMLSSKLSPDEKIELSIRIRALVEKNYIGTGQQEDLRKQIYYLQSVATEQLRQGQYRMALTTLQEADRLRNTLPPFETDVLRLLGEAVEGFLQNDPEPLTVLLRDPHVSFLDKRAILIELETLLHRPDAFQEIVLRKQRYTGSFIDLIREAGYKTGSLIWVNLEHALERENIYHDSEITPELARSAFPDDTHQPVFPQGIIFQSLHVKYSKDSVLVSLQGTVPQQYLQEFYSSVCFTPEMFTDQLEYADKSMLSHYWNINLQHVQFADFVIKETEETVRGAFVFAYQEGEQGTIEFYLSYYAW